jgi:hypothetical protein
MQTVNDLHFWVLFIAPAIVASLDALTGLSGWVASRLNRPNRADAILLVEVLIAVGGVIWWFHHRSSPYVSFVDYSRWEEVKAQLQRAKIAGAHFREVVNIDTLLWMIETAFAVACAVMAMRQRRNLILWLPLAFLSNLGGLIWLTVNRNTGRQRAAKV